MREILFKAKRTGTGEWFEGVPVDVTPLQCFSEPQAKEIVMVRAGFADWGMPRSLEYTKVDPETVCQYTGLKDKNGVKIFEGDIVECKTNAYAFHEFEIQWSGKSASWTISKGINKFKVDSSFEYEIIGNIHDKEDEHD